MTDEWLLLLKTDDPAGVTARVEVLHPYECPCVLSFPVRGNAAYTAWVRNQLDSGRGARGPGER